MLPPLRQGLLVLCGPQPAGRWREGGGSLGLGGIRGRGEREIVEFFRARNTRLRVGTDGQPVSSKSFLEFPPRGCVIARAESVRGAREKESEHHSRGIPLRKRRCLSGKGRKEGRKEGGTLKDHLPSSSVVSGLREDRPGRKRATR